MAIVFCSITDFFTEAWSYIFTHPAAALIGTGIFLGGIFFKRIVTKFKYVLYFLSDNTIMGKHRTDVENVFNNKLFIERLPSFVEHLKQRIYILNQEANWGSENFTPLDAEVEIQVGNSKKRKIDDLLTAIRFSPKNQAFLIIGDPGSGKSVALRKLSERLLNEVTKAAKIPIYLNLKEWISNEKWGHESPPTVKQLYDFVYSQLHGQTDFSDAFLNDYFYTLFKHGHLFFIFDSFDEIPMVLDVEENSWLIDKLSEVIYSFVANTNNSGGILASRRFRKPTLRYKAKIRFYIRPFTFKKIQQTLVRSANFSPELIQTIFNERLDLVSLARNPFSASLLAKFVQNNQRLPGTQMELYDDYINKRLSGFEKYNPEISICRKTLIETAQKLSYYIFGSKQYGLEIPVADVRKIFGDDSENFLVVLNYTKIGRIGHGFTRKFSFAHRRFYEFFVAREFLNRPGELKLASIPADSRWRDSLVLYCEIAPTGEAKRIANFCWDNYLKKLDSNTRDKFEQKEWAEVMHTYRFLADAFRNRKECLSDFKILLEFLIRDRFISDKRDILELNVLAQGIGLLQESQIPAAVSIALNVKSKMISEAAINACRHLPNLNNHTLVEVIEFYDRINNFEFCRKSASYIFPLKLSSSFNKIYQFAKLKFLTICIRFSLFLILFFLNLQLLILYCIIQLIIPNFRKHSVLNILQNESSKFNKAFGIVFSHFIYTSRGLKDLIFLVFSFLVINLQIDYFSLLLTDNVFVQNLLIVLLAPIPIVLPFFVTNSLLTDTRLKFTRPNSLELQQPRSSIREKWKQVKSIYKLAFNDFKKDISSFRFDFKKLRTAIFLEGRMRREFWIILLMTFLPVVVIGFVVAFVVAFPTDFRILFGTYTFICFVILGIFCFIILLCFRILKRVRDTRLLRTVLLKDKNEIWSRKVVETYFNRFETKRGRFLFVKYLYNEDIQASGTWANNIVPSFENDDASDLLAQLEARWLGIER